MASMVIAISALSILGCISDVPSAYSCESTKRTPSVAEQTRHFVDLFCIWTAVFCMTARPSPRKPVTLRTCSLFGCSLCGLTTVLAQNLPKYRPLPLVTNPPRSIGSYRMCPPPLPPYSCRGIRNDGNLVRYRANCSLQWASGGGEG
jgi:hypothetical protein